MPAMSKQEDESAFEAFVARHAIQLQANNKVPKALWRALWKKCSGEVLDLGDIVQLQPLPPAKTNRTAVYELVATTDISALPEGGHWVADVSVDSNSIFLLDHLWTFALPVVKEELLASPPLLERLKHLFVAAPGNAGSTEADETEAEESEEETAMINLVVDQSHVSREAAKDALLASDYQVVDAIQRLTCDNHSEAVLSGLQDSIAGGITTRDPVDHIIHCIKQQNLAYMVKWKDSTGADKETRLSFIMDEVGSSMSHHPSNPNFKIANFLYISGDGEVTPYTLAWPLRDVKVGETITRNFNAAYE